MKIKTIDRLKKDPAFKALEAVYKAMTPLNAEKRRRVIEAIHTWPDHAPLNRLALPPTGGLPVICTAKDAVKLRENPSIDGSQCWIAPLTLSLPDAFWTAFDRFLPSKKD